MLSSLARMLLQALARRARRGRQLPWLALLGCTLAAAQPVSNAPFPALEAGMHTARIIRFAVDRAGRYGVSASQDKTARVWDLASGRLLQTLRVPVGDGDEGKLFAVAISPDGERVAVGGWTSPSGFDESVHVFDRATGRLVGRIGGLPLVVAHLAWSPDGRRLAIALRGKNGIRLHAATPPYAEVARDTTYQNDSYSVDFDRSGRLVSTSYDGRLRLYDPALRPIVPPRAVSGGARPFFARFSPDGRRIAVGFEDSTAVQVVSGADLAPLQAMDTSAASGGDLSKVSWSADGRRLFAAGRNQLADGQQPVRVFDPASGRELAAWPVSTDTVMDLQPLADGRLVFAGQAPAWGVVDADGRVLTRQDPPIPDHGGNFDDFRVSRSGDRLAFKHDTWKQGRWQRETLAFDLRRLALVRGDAPATAELAAPRRDGLPMQQKDWKDTPSPTLGGRRLALQDGEWSQSLAIAADARHFALGSEWSLRWFDAQGTQRWVKPVPGAAWLVNASGDGRFVVAALGDGTMRWYRTADGSEALALFVHADGLRWVVWTPEGFFAASPDGEGLMGHVLNQGSRDKEAEFVGAAQFGDAFYRPDLIARRIDGDEAAIRAALAEVGDVRQLLAAGLPPQVELLSDPNPTVAVGSDYELKLKITPRKGGVGRLSLRINGAEQAVGRDALPTGGFYSVKLRNQPPGSHPVQVAIGGAGNRLLSRAVSVNLTVQGVAARPRLHLLAVGVSRYYDPALRDGVGYASRDAAALVDNLRRYADTEVVDLAPPTLLQDEAATRDGIDAALRAIARDAKPQDLVVLFLAGHGTEDNGDYFFQPWEARYSSRARLLEQSLSGKLLRERLADVKANKALVLLDTCASATFQLAQATRGDTKDAVNRFATLSGRAVISASAGKAREHPELRHGLFTDALLRGLAGAAANADGKVTVSGLADFVGDDVEKAALRLFKEPQLPQAEFVRLNNFTVSRKR